MDSQLDLLEQHIAQLEQIVYKEKVIYPDPPVREEDHIDPELIKMMKDKNLWSYSGVRRVPADYYQKPLDYRMQCVGCQKIEQLCKCVLFEVKDAPDKNKRFVCLCIQYVDSFSSSKLQAVISKLLGKNVTDIGLADENIATELTGSKHNAMTPVFMRPSKKYETYEVPIILSEKIAALDPHFFWLGGGEIDTKFGIETRKFITTFKPYIADISA
ncbi:hypothetical protein TVAG_140400 [Trichomonas vaginalis G3]|uniref:YbaK/aminoacyl-tRNA synthetase-associated domain-containing protein n=1 Tax=Trichomonas vaginalis (strain ATCC PRA-98 / G3) TaxID=412133 RepID=A2EJS8_TRIV3|nr:YbaK/aminoacyl-tRNA synthetase-associated domain-containing protein family [Trichomonas vaginalis G3]EAY07066.1 hypothetical protein TVAG_140400 [Trichomonas vaginalis G3]KAI5535260.1 YbaK/aminoacyl-tRNA synthetase-associated domain-containing protein family [Trichomonas vaginalis G3]|eukprot:XP_001319289.1 hypothetical protein [Trichomonas vaginalis G3]